MSNPVISKEGTKRWFNYKRLLHRIGGHAIETKDGSKEWWFEGKRHRLDGAAIERVSGYKEWYVDDIEVTEEDYPQAVLLYKCEKVLES